MPTSTIYLRFSDRAAALVALTARGMTVVGSNGEPVIPSPGYLAGARFDLVPLGGDGIYRKPIGTETIEIDGLGPIEQPVFEARPGWHVDFVWHGSAETVPDFGDAAGSPSTAWAYDGEPAAGQLPLDVPASVTSFQAKS